MNSELKKGTYSLLRVFDFTGPDKYKCKDNEDRNSCCLLDGTWKSVLSMKNSLYALTLFNKAGP